MADNNKKLTKAEEANIQKLLKSYEDFYGESAKLVHKVKSYEESDVVYKTESEEYEEYCDENDLL
jgi:hypothetical protein